jgi:hypothetical protein
VIPTFLPAAIARRKRCSRWRATRSAALPRAMPKSRRSAVGYVQHRHASELVTRDHRARRLANRRYATSPTAT